MTSYFIPLKVCAIKKNDLSYNQFNKSIETDKKQKKYPKYLSNTSATYSLYSQQKPKFRELENVQALQNQRKCHEILKGVEMKRGKLLTPTKTQKLQQIMNHQYSQFKSDLTSIIPRPQSLGETRSLVSYTSKEYFGTYNRNKIHFTKPCNLKNIQSARSPKLYKKSSKKFNIQPFRTLETTETEIYEKKNKNKPHRQTVWKLGKYQ